jgi:hypothetical protein
VLSLLCSASFSIQKVKEQPGLLAGRTNAGLAVKMTRFMSFGSIEAVHVMSSRPGGGFTQLVSTGSESTKPATLPSSRQLVPSSMQVPVPGAQAVTG